MNGRPQSLAEEVVNVITHGAGALVALAGLWALWSAADGDPLRAVAGSVYGSSVVAQLSASAAYHAVPWPRAKRWLLAVDHAAIFVLIAGTWTPFAAVSLGGLAGALVLGAVWAVALAGALLETVFLGRWWQLSTALYVLLGWAGVALAWPLSGVLPWEALAWLLGGGVAYTGGVVFFCWERLRWHHGLWHLCVLAGAACHFVAVKGWVLPG